MGIFDMTPEKFDEMIEEDIERFEMAQAMIKNFPVLLIYNNRYSGYYSKFLDEVRANYDCLDINLASTPLAEVCKMLSEKRDGQLPVFTNIEEINPTDKNLQLQNLVRALIKRDLFQYKGYEFDFMKERYLLVAVGVSHCYAIHPDLDYEGVGIYVYSQFYNR